MHEGHPAELDLMLEALIGLQLLRICWRQKVSVTLDESSEQMC